jgi:hypothetical protein
MAVGLGPDLDHADALEQAQRRSGADLTERSAACHEIAMMGVHRSVKISAAGAIG